MLTKSTVYTEQSKHRSVVRIHMNVKAFTHHQFCRKYEYHISTYEFPRTLRLLLSPPIPNCNMLQHISHLRIQVTGDPTNMEPHKKKSHHFFCWKIQIRLVISQAVGFSYTNSTTNSLATVHLQCPMVFVVGYLSFNYSPNGAVFLGIHKIDFGFYQWILDLQMILKYTATQMN